MFLLGAVNTVAATVQEELLTKSPGFNPSP
jgi:hypothetical protein